MAGGLLWVDFSLIDEDPANPRGDVGDVTDLKLSITRNGQQDPIQVIPQGNGRFFLHEGHRRRKAMEELGEQGARAIERRFTSEQQRVVSQGVLHLHRKTFDPMAWARYCRRLWDEFNMSREEIARELGMSQVWVRNHLSFMHLLSWEQRALERGDMTQTDALRRLASRRGAREGNPPAQQRQRRKAVVSAATISAELARPKRVDPHFNADHQLAHLVAEHCASRGVDHDSRPKLGDVGCGQCWEAVIRDDVIAAAPVLAAA